MKWLIQGIAFLVVVSVTELALSQTCPQSTATINVFLQNFQKCQSCTVAYAWTGAHWDVPTSKWSNRQNPTDAISSSQTGARVSQTWNSSFPHGASSDASNASASAQCFGNNCEAPSLTTSACVTSKFDSAGAGAYARAGLIVPAKSKTAKKSAVTYNIPSRMALYSNIGDESGVWGMAVSIKKGANHNTLVEKGRPDIAPFLVDLLGLKNEKQFKVHNDKQRIAMFVAGFELNPQGTNIKLIGPDGEGWMNLTKEQPSSPKAIKEALEALRTRFVIGPCKWEGGNGKIQVNDDCHMAEYRLENQEHISIEVPYEFLEEPLDANSDQILYIEVGQGGRDVIQTDGAIDSNPTSP